jgi:hypothetical protein
MTENFILGLNNIFFLNRIFHQVIHMYTEKVSIQFMFELLGNDVTKLPINYETH